MRRALLFKALQFSAVSERAFTFLHSNRRCVQALKYFDGGQIDGQVVSVELTLNRTVSRRSPARKSPVRRRFVCLKRFSVEVYRRK